MSAESTSDDEQREEHEALHGVPGGDREDVEAEVVAEDGVVDAEVGRVERLLEGEPGARTRRRRRRWRHRRDGEPDGAGVPAQGLALRLDHVAGGAGAERRRQPSGQLDVQVDDDEEERPRRRGRAASRDQMPVQKTERRPTSPNQSQST